MLKQEILFQRVFPRESQHEQNHREHYNIIQQHESLKTNMFMTYNGTGTYKCFYSY